MFRTNVTCLQPHSHILYNILKHRRTNTWTGSGSTSVPSSYSYLGPLNHII
uniref:Uncharacterized protein n=1 Tax=Manihot esculenta TaxID=3983 RepID=A0A2C9VRS3_MANES